MKKFEFTGETKTHFGVELKQIRALRDFGVIKKGDLGGWLAEEESLSHDGNAWVYGDASVSGDARVYGDDFLVIHPIGSERGTLTACKAGKGIQVSRGCFLGSLEEFEKAVDKTHGDNEYGKQYKIVIDLIKAKLGE
jgi:hypothetical protein